jgi:hypothetical protein
MSLIRKNSSINRYPISGQVNEGNDLTHLTMEYNEIEVVETSKLQRCCAPINKFLKAISLGKYDTKLYFDGEPSQSSSIGGIITIICGLVIAFYALVVILNVFSKETYHLDAEARAF